MKLRLIPALLTLGLATLLGACETVENPPTQPGSEIDNPQGGAELDEPPAPDALPADGSSDASEIPAAPDAEVPAIPDAEAPALDTESPDATDAPDAADSPAP